MRKVRISRLVSLWYAGKTVLVTLLAASFLTLPEVLRAEEFLGIEGEVDAEEIERQSGYRPPRSSLSTLATEESPDAGRWTFCLGLGATKISFTGSFCLGYFSNKYLGTQVSGIYKSFDDGQYYSRQHGGELALIARVPNPTIVTPYIGAGPGYENWHQVYQDVTFDDSHALTFVTFAGINISFSRYFGMSVKRKLTAYVTDVPLNYKDRTTKLDNMYWQTIIGFYAGI